MISISALNAPLSMSAICDDGLMSTLCHTGDRGYIDTECLVMGVTGVTVEL